MKPLFIWAGGKNKMLKHYRPFMPHSIDTYIEPFFGGGAMFIQVMELYKPKHAYINDINPDIARVYSTVKENPTEFMERLDELSLQYLPLDKPNRKLLYYEIRQEHAYDYEKWSVAQEAATLYFLMKTGFNGIWQINQNTNGRYGTPAGLLTQKTEVYSKSIVNWWHRTLQGVTITSLDWKECVDGIPESNNPFYFFDPPYRDSFTSYGQVFGDDKQRELIDYSKNVNGTVMICNKDSGDGFFDNIGNLQKEIFNATHTAGRRKKTDEGFEALSVKEVLLHNTGR